MRVQPKEDEFGRVDQSGNKAIEDPTVKLHDRLRKILQLTKSPSEQEAQSAAALLQRFLVEHNLSIADLEKKGGTAPGMRQEGHDLGKAAFKWKLDLAEGIAEFYYCAPLVDRRTKTVAFVGRPDNVDALTALYAWVIDQIKEIATVERRKHYDATSEHIDPLRWQLGFGEGAVIRLIDRLREMKARQEEDAARNSMGDIVALAVHHQKEVSDWLEENGRDRLDGRKTKRQLEWEERWAKLDAERQAEREAKDSLRIQCEESGDMGPYWAKYPNEHPDEIAKTKAWLEKERREEEKKERRNAARRRGPAYRPGKSVDWDAEEEKGTAREAGKAAADRVNLQPFIGSGGAKPGAKKIG